MKFTLKRLCTGALMTILCTHAGAIDYTPQNAEATLMLKTPGNHSVTYPLSMKKADNGYCTYELVSGRAIPVTVYQKLKSCGKDVRVYLLEGADHGRSEFWTEETQEIVVKFFNGSLTDN